MSYRKFKKKAQEEPEPWDDLDHGEDMRGDTAYFIKEKHFLGDGWKVDEEARTGISDTIFFRVIDENGIETDTHGFLKDDTVIQIG